MLQLLARPDTKVNLAALSITELLAGNLYVSLRNPGADFGRRLPRCARFLPLGEFGTFISGGAIPLISALLGIKVGAELSVIVDRFRS